MYSFWDNRLIFGTQSECSGGKQGFQAGEFGFEFADSALASRGPNVSVARGRIDDPHFSIIVEDDPKAKNTRACRRPVDRILPTIVAVERAQEQRPFHEPEQLDPRGCTRGRQRTPADRA